MNFNITLNTQRTNVTNTNSCNDKLLTEYYNLYLKNIDRLIAEKNDYDPILSKKHTELYYCLSTVTLKNFENNREAKIFKYLLSKYPDLKEFSLHQRKSIANLFIKGKRERAVKELLIYQMGIVQWVLDASEQQKKESANKITRQMNSISSFIGITRPLSE